MREYVEWLRFRASSIPRNLAYLISGLFFMCLSVILDRASDNVIIFIFAACFALLGLVLFMMSLINGLIDVFRDLRKRAIK